MEKSDFIEIIDRFPRRPGVYFFKDAQGGILYVGKALSLKDRLRSYFREDPDRKTRLMRNRAHEITFIETGSEFAALLLEATYIRKFQPRFNISLKDDKSYIYVFVTNGRFPRVTITRRPNIDASIQIRTKGGTYYGPFPSAKTTRGLLKDLRRIFPFCQQKDSKRACFYSHLGICKPCPAEILRQPPEEAKQLTLTYRKNIAALKKILAGRLAGVKKYLHKQMNELSRNEKYEAAAAIRNQLSQLDYVTQKGHTAAFMENANFYFAAQKEALVELKNLLLPYFPVIAGLHRIECFDISTLGGKFSAGSQVVFIDGIPEKSLYRRYRIHLEGRANDVAMLAEMISRRLQHREWSTPDLLVVDGGKPQVSYMARLLESRGSPATLIGLAKRLERIVLLKNGRFVEVALPRSHKALKLLQQLRDEAHRFAVTYHRMIRQRRN